MRLRHRLDLERGKAGAIAGVITAAALVWGLGALAPFSGFLGGGTPAWAGQSPTPLPNPNPTLFPVVIAPRATASPSQDLVDRQTITIHASGFHPHVPLQVLECSGTVAAPPLSSRQCDGYTLDMTGYTDAHGTYVNEPHDPSGDTNGFTVRVLPNADHRNASVPCDVTHRCVLYVGEDHNNFNQPHALVPLTFRVAALGLSGGGRQRAGGTGLSGVLPEALGFVVLVLVGVVYRRYRARRGARGGGRAGSRGRGRMAVP